ncbi:MAG: GNAT family N-acetyltransferase [Candidatus Nanoarchaeia archaeon]
MEVTVRRAVYEDIPFLKLFQKKLVDSERPFDPTIPREGEIEYYSLKELLESKEVNFLVVEVEKKVVGCGFGEIRKNVEWGRSKRIGYIGLMFVEEEFRGNKIGKMLVDRLCEWFKERKVGDIRLKVLKKNIRAIKLYEKAGFEEFIIEMRRADPIFL